ncbi:MAG: hypothetical protein U0526_02350 [Candidatus Saccharibacteria bacterium]|jgi:hypothetical protein
MSLLLDYAQIPGLRCGLCGGDEFRIKASPATNTIVVHCRCGGRKPMPRNTQIIQAVLEPLDQPKSCQAPTQPLQPS